MSEASYPLRMGVSQKRGTQKEKSTPQENRHEYKGLGCPVIIPKTITPNKINSTIDEDCEIIQRILVLCIQT